MRSENQNPRPEFPPRFIPFLAAVCLALAVLACRAPTPTPAATPTVYVPPTEIPPTEELSPTPTEPPPTPTPTPPPTPTPTGPPPAVCPPAGSPSLVQPASFADYPVAIQQYLSAGGDVATLEARLAGWGALPEETGQVAANDLTGDGVPEVIVAVKDPVGGITFSPGHLLVLGCRDGAYVLHHRESTEGLIVRLKQVNDVNGDGQPEVVYTLSSCGAHTCYDTLEILGWDGAGFASLMGGELNMPYPTYTVSPGRIEADSGGIGSVGAEPQRGYAEIWEWDGSVFTITQQLWEPPVYRYHALLDGDRALLAEDYVTAVATYEGVINDDGLEEWGAVSEMMDPAEERAQLTAFARWRLMLAHLLMDDVAGAQADYNRLQAGHPPGSAGHDVALMAAIFWGEYLAGGNVGEGCTQVVAAAEVDTSVQDFFNQNYGYANPWWEPVDLCPFTE